MKLSLIVVSVCVCMFGCGSDPSTEKDHTTSSEPSGDYFDSPGNGSNWSSPCDRPTFVTVHVDGGTYTVEVPTLCNPNPDTRGGDPPPDYQVDPDPWDRQVHPSNVPNEKFGPASRSGGERS